jgi:hypothetical protein
MQGTIESILAILIEGRINDSYALLRKFYDASIINLYIGLYLDEHYSFENRKVAKIDDWLTGKEEIPEFKIMSNFVISSQKVTEITKLLYPNCVFKGSPYDQIRKRCNQNTHLIYYHNLLSNIHNVAQANRIKILDELSIDLNDIAIHHLSYLFYLRDNYLMSSDYMDSINCGMIPDENSELRVEPFIQNFFDDKIKKYRPDIAKKIIRNTKLDLK